VVGADDPSDLPLAAAPVVGGAVWTGADTVVVDVDPGTWWSSP